MYVQVRLTFLYVCEQDVCGTCGGSVTDPEQCDDGTLLFITVAIHTHYGKQRMALSPHSALC